MPRCCDLRCYSTGMNNGESTSARGHYLILRHYSTCWLVPELFLHDMEGELPAQVHVVSYYCVWHSHLETRQGFHCCDIDHQLPQTEKMIDTLPMPWFGLPAPEIRSAMLIGTNQGMLGVLEGTLPRRRRALRRVPEFFSFLVPDPFLIPET